MCGIFNHFVYKCCGSTFFGMFSINKKFKIKHKNTSIEYLKGTVSIISSKPPCKDGNAQFTAVSLRPVSDQK